LTLKCPSPLILGEDSFTERFIGRMLKNSFYVIPELFIGNPAFVNSRSYGFSLSRE